MLANWYPSLMVFLGAGLGGLLRWILSGIWTPQQSHFPWPTMAINITGCFAIGAVVALLPDTPHNHLPRLLLISGVLGGYTTFSTFSREALLLLQTGRYAAAAVYVLGSVILGLTATLLAFRLIAGKALPHV
ncbi:MAG: fluoride efflux transporter CrcB [Tepidisphaerales bacterium]